MKTKKRNNPKDSEYHETYIRYISNTRANHKQKPVASTIAKNYRTNWNWELKVNRKKTEWMAEKRREIKKNNNKEKIKWSVMEEYQLRSIHMYCGIIWLQFSMNGIDFNLRDYQRKRTWTAQNIRKKNEWTKRDNVMIICNNHAMKVQSKSKNKTECM